MIVLRKILTLAFLLFLSSISFAQVNLKAYAGDWEGEFFQDDMFSFEISLHSTKDGNFLVRLNLGSTQIEESVSLNKQNRMYADFGEGVQFSAWFNSDNSAAEGFIRSGVLLYHLNLPKDKAGVYKGRWNLFMLDKMEPATAFIAFEVEENGNYAAYTVFGDSRFAGTWAGGFQREENKLSFQDAKTGLRFIGILEKEKIRLSYMLAGKKIGEVIYTKSSAPWALGTTAKDQISSKVKAKTFTDGWKTQSLKAAKIDEDPLQQMEQDIFSNTLTFTHGISIAKKGKLVYDRYFFGNDQSIPHEQRSSAKSYASAIIGIAIEEGILTGTEQKMYKLIPKAYQYTREGKKENISIHHLLTMSSGLDAIDFGLNRNSVASEDAYQSSSDWLKTILEAPMVNEPGAQSNYGSANPFLLGEMLNQALEEPMEHYIDQKLFKPLGIQNYIIQTDITGKPYFGGGWLLTPRDMLKFGQLYLNKGKWGKQQILSEEWVQKSFEKYGVLENTQDKNEYGYFWWHKTYTVAGKEIESIEARGSGGQYIFVVPSLDLVVAITSGNFRNGRYAQPEQIMEEYILPAVLGKK